MPESIYNLGFSAILMDVAVGALPSPALPIYSIKVNTFAGTRIRLFAAAALLAAAYVPLGAQTAPINATPARVGGEPFLQATYPLSEVHRGLHATAYTVFEGSKPEPFDVEILGVLHDAIGPGKDMILARLTGSKAEYDGVVAGMSGSPVYIDGKLLGAIGFRIGQFTKEPIAGITPIQQMLDVITQSDSSAMDSSARDKAAAMNSDTAANPYRAESVATGNGSFVESNSDAMERFAPNNALQPIETPLVFDGFSPAAINLFQRRFAPRDLVPVSGLGGASPNEPDTAPIVPGSAISAIIISGDFNMAATCTVTYVDPTRLLACGHPITRFGNISLPMSKAVVVATVASSLSPMKIVNTTETIGSFTEDRESGILGVFGKQARMIPVTLTIRGIAAPHTYRFAVVEHPKLTAAALIASVYQAMQDTNSYNDPSTYDLQGEIRVAGYPPVTIDEWIAPTDEEPSSLGAAIAVAQRFDSIFSNPRELPSIRSVSLTLDASPGRHSAMLVDANLLNPNVHAGERVTVEATLHPYRQPQRTIRMSVQLPSTLAPGSVRLLVSDGTTLDHTLHLIPNPAEPPAGLRETIARMNKLHPTNRIYVTLLSPVPQATLQGHDLPAVPLTMANVLQPDEPTDGVTLNGETAIPLLSQPLDLALSGSRAITVNVLP